MADNDYIAPVGGLLVPQSASNNINNRLNSMTKYLQGTGGIQRPQLFVGGNQKKVMIPADEASGGKWICTALRRSGVISMKDFIWLTNGHAIAVFTNGDFVDWYTKNAGKLVDLAEEADFDWKALSHLTDRMRDQYKHKGFKAAFETYIHLCSALYQLFGRDEEGIEPFRNAFYTSSFKERALGTLKVLTGRLFWKQVPTFVRLRLAGV
jgi:hypothetical protein